MKRLLTLLILFTCTCAFSAVLVPRNVIYFQDFEEGGMPLNWTEWNFLEFHDDTWTSELTPLAGTNSVHFAYGDPLLAYGAFYRLAFPCDDIKLHFLFRVNEYPSVFSVEIIDMYNANGDEIGDIYLSPQGRLQLFIGPGSHQTSLSMPTNVTLNLWFHYINRIDGNSTAVASWSASSTEPPVGDGQSVSANDGSYHTPVTRLLLGPVSDVDVHFEYDNFEVSLPFYGPKNLTVSGSVSVSGSTVFGPYSSQSGASISQP